MIRPKTIQCRVCGRAYKFYSMTVADQSACPACVREAEDAATRPSSPEQIRRRRDRWG